MGRKPKFTADQKLAAVEDVLIRHQSKRSVSKRLGPSVTNYLINYWIAEYKTYGIDGLKTSGNNRKYTEADRMEAIALVKNGQPVKAASVRLLIPACVISGWMKCYTNPIKGGTIMGNRGGKGVKKQYFGIDVMETAAKECIDSGHDYKGISAKYGVKYAALYSWVRKYESGGREALLRKKSGRKSAKNPKLTKEEKLQAELAKKDQRIRELEESLEILKKKEEISWKLATGQIKYGS